MADQNWDTCELREVIDIEHGFAFKGEFFRDEPKGDVLLTPGNFAKGGGFKSDNLKYYDGDVPEHYVLKPGTLLVTMTDLSKKADTLGYPAILPTPPDNHRFLHNQRLGKVVIKQPGRVCKRWLYYLMCTRRYRHHVLATMTGTTVKHTAPKRILNFEFDLPPIEQQRAVADILRVFDDKIELNRRMNKTLESTAQTLFKSWFVDFDPVIDNALRADNPIPEEFADRAAARHEAIDGGNPVVADDIAEHFPAAFEESDQGPIPVGWEIKALDEVADYLNGTAWQRYRAQGDEESLPVIKIRELRDGFSDNTDRASLDVPDKYIIENGDVIFSWSGSLLVKLWTGGRGVLNQHLFKVSSAKFPKWFYYLWTVEHLERFQRIAADKATTMGHIKRSHLTEALTLIPQKPLLDRMSKVMVPWLSRRINNDCGIRKLTETRDVLLTELISGRLKVGE